MEEFPAVLSWTWWMEGLGVPRAREWDYRIILGYPESFVQSFWCQRHQPLAFFYVISHGSSLSRECQYMSCNYRRNTHGVMKILNACWFNHDLSTHLFIMSTSAWCFVSKAQKRCLRVFWSKYLWTNTKFTMANKLYVQFTFYICFSHWSVIARGKICHQICGSREHLFFLFLKWMLSLWLDLGGWSWSGIPFLSSILYMLLNTLKWVNSVKSGLRRFHYAVC